MAQTFLESPSVLFSLQMLVNKINVCFPLKIIHKERFCVSKFRWLKE